MAVDLSKVMDLADGLEIYKDLRNRIKNIPVPEVPVVGLLINGLVMPITENKYIKFGVQNGINLVMNGSGTGFDLEAVIQDIRVNGTSVLQNGVANIPMGNASQLGVFKISNNEGIGAYSDGRLSINEASSTQIKAGSTTAKPIVPGNQHQSVFYGLTKAAGVDMAQSNNAVGTYTDAALQAIQKMLGLDGLFGDYQNGNTASKAYAVGETFVMDGKRYKVTAAISDGGLITVGTNCELDPIDGHYVRDTDYATNQKAGIAKVSNSFGLQMTNNSEVLAVQMAGLNEIKSATNYYKPIVPASIHQAAFFGLSKAAGVDLASETVTVGTYPETSKAAIQSMLGVSTGAILIENVSGGTPTLTCLPNVRYKCGEVSTLSITPPASGSCEVIFESGSTATLLTVPNTVKFPPWFDATALETGTIYDIIITDGVYGAVMSWAS